MSHAALTLAGLDHASNRSSISTKVSRSQNRHNPEVMKLIRLLARKSTQLPLYTRFQTTTGYETVPVTSVQVSRRGIQAQIANAEPLQINWEQLVGLVVLADNKGQPYFDTATEDVQGEIPELNDAFEFELAA